MSPIGQRTVQAGCLLSLAVLALLSAARPAFVEAQSRQVAGLMTEIKLGRGTVEVKPDGASDWRPAGPLMSLLPGDVVRASGDASAIVLLANGRGMLRIGPGTAPIVIPEIRGTEPKLQKAQAVLAASLHFLTSSARDIGHAIVATRASAPTPVVLAPRNGPVLADALVFEWAGNRFARYSVQISAVPEGHVVLEQKSVQGAAWTYPPNAPALQPGKRYVLRVIPEDEPAASETAWFEVADPGRTTATREALAQLERDAAGMLSPSTLAVVKTGYLADSGLMHEARRVLVDALARDRDEPTLYLLLGQVYAKIGLEQEAAQALDEARFLSVRRATR